MSDSAPIRRSDSAPTSRRGRFDDFGGQYVAPILIPVLDRLDGAFASAWSDVSFRQAFETLLRRFVGRPTPLFQASRLAGRSPARIVLKRDDLTFEGGNYATSALGQCLLAQRMGLGAVIADTGSGENGVATAAVAAQLGLACRVFIGSRDAAKNPVAVRRVVAFGSQVSIVDDRDATLHAAMSAALRHWMSCAETTAYVIGGPIGPHPFPTMVGAFAYDFYKSRAEMTTDHLGIIAIGFVVSFITALIVVKTFLDYVTRHGFQLFAWWRVIVGTIGLIALALGR